VEHECKKEDVDTAELIKKDSKPCPNCGEFIMKSSGCSQMFCITCKTPFDWNTGKIVTSGPIHNPHYYEWMKRNGQTAPRNPADVPCGGFPQLWELRRFPRGMKSAVTSIYYEFHRICQELQEISTRSYRSHLDVTTSNAINVQFLLGDFDEKLWGRSLAIQEKKKKRDAEIQEVFAAFRMIAVEIINRVQQYSDPVYPTITDLPVYLAEKLIRDLRVEIDGFIDMINDAMRLISISHSYSVPYVKVEVNAYDGVTYYMVHIKSFKEEAKKKKKQATSEAATSEAAASEAAASEAAISEAATSDAATSDADEVEEESKEVVEAVEAVKKLSAADARDPSDKLHIVRHYHRRYRELDDSEEESNDDNLQRAIAASLQQ